jgi:hypothetical protein
MRVRLLGFDQKADKWGSELFYEAFEAGVRARIAEGIPEPPREIPEDIPPAPPEYIGQNAKRVWSSAWGFGYAFAVRETPGQRIINRRRAHEWQRTLHSRRTTHFDPRKLAGCWRILSGKNSKYLRLSRSGLLAGAGLQDSVIVWQIVGQWSVEGDRLVFHYASYLHEGENGASYRACSILINLTPKTLKLATDQNSFERYSRIPKIPPALMRRSLLGKRVNIK